MPPASDPFTLGTTLKLSNVPIEIRRAVPPFGAFTLTYSKCLKPTGYFRSPNSDSPFLQMRSCAAVLLGSATFAPISGVATAATLVLRRVRRLRRMWHLRAATDRL